MLHINAGTTCHSSHHLFCVFVYTIRLQNVFNDPCGYWIHTYIHIIYIIYIIISICKTEQQSNCDIKTMKLEKLILQNYQKIGIPMLNRVTQQAAHRPILFWRNPYPEPLYTGWSSTLEYHWDDTGWSSVYGIPLGDPAKTCKVHWNTTGKLNWNCHTLKCHWKNFDYCSLDWNTTGKT